MKNIFINKICEVLVVLMCTILLIPDTWYAVQHARRVTEVVREWQDAGPHATLLGTLQERLAAAGWLASPRDPLVECGIPVGSGWMHFLKLMISSEGQLVCLEKQVQLAQKEHLTFRSTFLLVTACVISLTVVVIVLLGRAWTRVRLAWRHQQELPIQEAKEDVLPGEVRETSINEARAQKNGQGSVKYTAKAKSWPPKRPRPRPNNVMTSLVAIERLPTSNIEEETCNDGVQAIWRGKEDATTCVEVTVHQLQFQPSQVKGSVKYTDKAKSWPPKRPRPRHNNAMTSLVATNRMATSNTVEGACNDGVQTIWQGQEEATTHVEVTIEQLQFQPSQVEGLMKYMGKAKSWPPKRPRPRLPSIMTSLVASDLVPTSNIDEKACNDAVQAIPRGQEEATTHEEVTIEQLQFHPSQVEGSVKYIGKAKSWPAKRPRPRLPNLMTSLVATERVPTSNTEEEVCHDATQEILPPQEEATPPVEVAIGPLQFHPSKVEEPHVEEVHETLPKEEEGGNFTSQEQARGEGPNTQNEEGEICSERKEQHEDLPVQETAHEVDASPPASSVSKPEEKPEDGRIVRRTYHVPQILWQRLIRPGESLIESLQLRHSVQIFMDYPKRRIHIKGKETSTIECYNAVRAMVESLRRDAAEERVTQN